MVTSVRDTYTREMYGRTGLFASWPLPSAPVALGDVGVLKRNLFRKETTLTGLGIGFVTGPAGKPADVDYSTAEFVSVAASATAHTAGPGPSAGLTIRFTRAGAILFQARDCVMETIENLPGLEASLRDLRLDKTWRPEWCIITSLLRTGPTAIVISDEHGAVMELRADASALTAAIPVAVALGDFAVSSCAGITFKVLSKEGATPLFGVSQLRRKPWGQSALVFRGGGDQPALPEVELASVAWSDDDDPE